MHDLTMSFLYRVRLFGVIVLLITEVDFRINFIWSISLKMIQLTIQHYMLIEYLLFSIPVQQLFWNVNFY